jgi:hypothetical protein
MQLCLILVYQFMDVILIELNYDIVSSLLPSHLLGRNLWVEEYQEQFPICSCSCRQSHKSMLNVAYDIARAMTTYRSQWMSFSSNNAVK